MGGLQENELMMLLIGVGVFIFIQIYHQKLKRIQNWRILKTSFYILLLGLLCTNLEGFILKGPLNLLEHICYATNSFLLLMWCYKSFPLKNIVNE